jgi:type IV secretory pathway protease TraF
MISRSAVLVTMTLGIVAIGATAGSGTAPRLVWSVSGSVPTGLYRVRPARGLTDPARRDRWPGRAVVDVTEG